MVRLAGLRSYARLVREKLGNQLTAGRFAGEVTANGPVPDDGGGAVLRGRTGERVPVRAVAAAAGGTRHAAAGGGDRRPARHRPAGARRPAPCRSPSPGPAGSSRPWSSGTGSRPCSTSTRSSRTSGCSGSPSRVHIQLGHGESDKGGSVSNQHKAYDLTFVGGPAGRERLARALYDFDAEARIREVGRPAARSRRPRALPTGPTTVGCGCCTPRPGRATGPASATARCVSHGAAIIDALRADPRVRIIYRPHPRTGRASAAHGAADARIRAALAADGDRHLIDTGPYGWQWRFADACITDVSAVAYDWLATGKPLVITEPAARCLSPAVAAAGSAAAAAGRAGRRHRARCCRSGVRSWLTWRRTTSGTRPTARARSGSRRP